MVFRMDRKHAALLQVGIAIIAIILFIGVLNSVVYSYRTPLVTTESLWQHAKNVTVRFELRTADASQFHRVYARLADVAVYHAGHIYINVPYTQSHPLLTTLVLYLWTVDGRPLTVARLIESGASRIYLYLEPVNTTAVTFSPTLYVSELMLTRRECFGCVLQFLTREYTTPSDPDTKKFQVLFPDGGRLNRTVQLDVGQILLSGMGHGSEEVALTRAYGDARNLRGLKLRVEVYGVSEKPVLRALTEPIYSFFAALYATLLAVVRKVKQYAASAFGGFVSSFTLTGLIGDPVTALILTMVFVTVVFLVIKKK